MARVRRRYRHKHISGFTKFGIIVLTLVLCGTMLYKTAVLKAGTKEYSQQISQLKQEKSQVDKRSEELDEFEKYVNTDEYIEEMARDRLGLVYEDEIIFEPDTKDR